MQLRRECPSNRQAHPECLFRRRFRRSDACSGREEVGPEEELRGPEEKLRGPDTDTDTDTDTDI